MNNVLKKVKCKGIAAVLLMWVFLVFLAVGGAFEVNAAQEDTAEEDGLGVSPWNKVDLHDGDVYDVGSASANTSVYIKKPGTYTLKGESSKMRLVIKSGGVNVYLANGLKITPGSRAYVGSRTSAITIEEQGGTVKLISKKNAKIRMSSYLTSPAIYKNGTKTKLIFETEDPDNPGTITADTPNASSCAGIGSNYTLTGRPTMGNIVFNSGTVKSYGDNLSSAGIGGSAGGSVEGITINGGYVYAKGGSNGAGIGGGLHGSANNIKINGGKVIAHGGDNGSAGIGGSGVPESRTGEKGTNITINGGTVEAYGGRGGTGIGGGAEAAGKNITINGGTVKAYGGYRGNGIGGGGFASEPESGAGINIRINGGTVEAHAGSDGAAIGGGKGSRNKSDITITGGTVIAQGGGDTYGLDIGGKEGSSVCIIGGSVKAGSVSERPVNQQGSKLYRTDVQLETSGDAHVSSVEMSGMDMEYGLKDVHAMNSDIYLWLPQKPKTAAVTAATDKNKMIYTAVNPGATPGKIEAGKRGMLYRASEITLKSTRDEVSDGSAYGVACKDVLKEFKPVKDAITGYHVDVYTGTRYGYWQQVCDKKGNLKPNSKIEDVSTGKMYDATDKNSRWLPVGGPSNLYAQWEPNEFTVDFDKNKPENASHDVTGTMNKQKFVYKKTEKLAPSQYAMDGWIFTGWNTKADGSGDAYDDEGDASTITAKDGETVTLYAQWKAKEYTITLKPGIGEGYDKTQTLYYDTPAALTSVSELTFYKEDYAFAGWSHGALGHVYANGATVCNLCELDNTGAVIGRTLTAQWHKEGVVTVQVTKDNRAVNVSALGIDGGWDGVALKDPQGAYYKLADGDSPGVYQAAFLGVTGTNKLCLMKGSGETAEYYETGKSITLGSDGTGIAALDYCTVKMKVDGGADYGTAWIVDGSSKKTEMTVLTDTQVAIDSDVIKTGYKFVKYTAVGNQPTWGEGGQESKNQTVTITGQTEITARTSAISYHVEFDANADASGDMETQDFVYDREQKLFACAYEREGYTFAGWTLTPEWVSSSEDVYDDKAAVKNLTDKDGETVTLYAQWNPQPYYINYNSNGADAGIQLDLQKTYYNSDTVIQTRKQLDFSLENYHFTGWNTEAGGNGNAYDGGQHVSNLTTEDEGKVILWAQWEHDSYTVYYDANGGQGSMDAEEIWTDMLSPLAPTAFTKSGYTFTGWNTAKNGSGTGFKDGQIVENIAEKNGSVTLYAQWKAKNDGGAGADTGDKTHIVLYIIIMLTAAGIIKETVKNFV